MRVLTTESARPYTSQLNCLVPNWKVDVKLTVHTSRSSVSQTVTMLRDCTNVWRSRPADASRNPTRIFDKKYHVVVASDCGAMSLMLIIKNHWLVRIVLCVTARTVVHSLLLYHDSSDLVHRTSDPEVRARVLCGVIMPQLPS